MEMYVGYFCNLSELTVTSQKELGERETPNAITVTLKMKIMQIKFVTSTVILKCDKLYNFERTSLQLKQHRHLVIYC